MTSIAFTGDIAFSQYFKYGYEKPDLVDTGITDFLTSADHVVANIEAPVTAGVLKSDQPLKHVNAPEAVEKLLEWNAHIWNLANNHTVDCGAEGLQDTLNIAKANGVTTFGAGLSKLDAARILELPESGGIGIFGITYLRPFLKADAEKPGCITWEDDEIIRHNIQTIKARNRWCVIVAHCGQEFSNIPMPYVRRRYLQWLELGADVIIGHHPHVVQNYEQVGDKMIFYSLGNFVFDTDYQRRQRYSEYGVFVKLYFSEDHFTWEHHATRVDREHNRIVSCTPPAVFTNIVDKEYRRLWPLGVRDYFRNHRSCRIYFRPERAQNNARQWFKEDKAFFGLSALLELHLGLLLARLGVGRRADPRLVDYLRIE